MFIVVEIAWKHVALQNGFQFREEPKVVWGNVLRMSTPIFDQKLQNSNSFMEEVLFGWGTSIRQNFSSLSKNSLVQAYDYLQVTMLLHCLTYCRVLKLDNVLAIIKQIILFFIWTHDYSTDHEKLAVRQLCVQKFDSDFILTTLFVRVSPVHLWLFLKLKTSLKG